MRNYLKKTVLVLTAVLALLFWAASPVEAAVQAFIVKDDQGSYYEYNYEDLLDAYALTLVGESNSYYEDYAEKEIHALINNDGEYIDYKDALDSYAEAIALGERFDLEAYLTGEKAKQLEISGDVTAINPDSGRVASSGAASTISNPGMNLEDLLAEFDPPGSRSPIVGAAGVLEEQALKWAEENDAAEELLEVVPLYWRYAEKTGMRPEVLFAQAALETNLGHYSEEYSPEHYNYAGILKGDATEDGPENHEKFASPEEGVRAHYNHMAAYTGLSPIGDTHDRYNVAATQSWSGSVIYVEDLSGRWSPSEDYHLHILAVMDLIANTEVEGLKEEEPTDPEEEEPDQDREEKIEELKDREHVAVDVAEITVLNLRSGPSTDHDVLGRLVRGTVLEVTGSEGIWLEIITPDDKEGWVHGDYVRPVDLSENPFEGNYIILDPGHGGNDPGAVGAGGLTEKEINLGVARYLEEMLIDAGAKVKMTRSGDQTVSNSKRIELANEEENADVFVSIHANAYSDPESNGIETYYCSNSDDGDAGRFLAQQLQREMISALGLRDRGVKTRSFMVLKETKMPSALVEIGFVSNPDEEEMLKKEETRKLAAESLYYGLESYLRKFRE